MSEQNPSAQGQMLNPSQNGLSSQPLALDTFKGGDHDTSQLVDDSGSTTQKGIKDSIADVNELSPDNLRESEKIQSPLLQNQAFRQSSKQDKSRVEKNSETGPTQMAGSALSSQMKNLEEPVTQLEMKKMNKDEVRVEVEKALSKGQILGGVDSQTLENLSAPRFISGAGDSGVLEEDSVFQNDVRVFQQIENDLNKIKQGQKFTWFGCMSVKRQFPANISNLQQSVSPSNRVLPPPNYYIEKVTRDKAEMAKMQQRAVNLDYYARNILCKQKGIDSKPPSLKAQLKSMGKHMPARAKTIVSGKQSPRGGAINSGSPSKRSMGPEVASAGYGSSMGVTNEGIAEKSRQNYWNPENSFVLPESPGRGMRQPISTQKSMDSQDGDAPIDKHARAQRAAQEAELEKSIVSTLDQSEIHKEKTQTQHSTFRPQRLQSTARDSIGNSIVSARAKNKEIRHQNQKKTSDQLKNLAKFQMTMGQMQSQFGNTDQFFFEQARGSLMPQINLQPVADAGSKMRGISTSPSTYRMRQVSQSFQQPPTAKEQDYIPNSFQKEMGSQNLERNYGFGSGDPQRPFMNKTGSNFFERNRQPLEKEPSSEMNQSEMVKMEDTVQGQRSPQNRMKSIDIEPIVDSAQLIREQDNSKLALPFGALSSRPVHQQANIPQPFSQSEIFEKMQERRCLEFLEQQQSMAYKNNAKKISLDSNPFEVPEVAKSKMANPFSTAIDRSKTTSAGVEEQTTLPLVLGAEDGARNNNLLSSRMVSERANTFDGPSSLVQKVNRQIEQDVEQHLQGDAATMADFNNDPRVLNSSNPNFYFVRKSDFNSPNMYNLHIIKPFGRSRIRTFVPSERSQGDNNQKQYISSFQSKFFSKIPHSSQNTKNRNRFHNQQNLQTIQQRTKKWDEVFKNQFNPKGVEELWEKHSAKFIPPPNFTDKNTKHCTSMQNSLMLKSMVHSPQVPISKLAQKNTSRRLNAQSVPAAGLQVSNCQGGGGKTSDRFYKKQTLDINKREVLNAFDYSTIKGEDDSAEVGSEEKKKNEVQIPKVQCHLMVSELNREIHKNRLKKKKEAERKYEEERNREIMNNVLKNLHKKDSVKLLLEQYEGSLHRADHIADSPRANKSAALVKKEDFEEDDFSESMKKASGMQPAAAISNALAASNSKEQKQQIDKKIIAMTTKIRNQQNWISKANEVEIEDFDGDEAAFLKFKVDHGVRKLSQDEKMLMFGLVDSNLRDNINSLKKMIGINNQPLYGRRKKTFNPKVSKGGTARNLLKTVTPGGASQQHKQDDQQSVTATSSSQVPPPQDHSQPLAATQLALIKKDTPQKTNPTNASHSGDRSPGEAATISEETHTYDSQTNGGDTSSLMTSKTGQMS